MASSPAEASAIKVLEGVRVLQEHNPKATLVGLDKCILCDGPGPESSELGVEALQKLLDLGWEWDSEQSAWSFYTGHG